MLLVLSPGPALATIMQAAGYDVLDGRPGDARAWTTIEDVPGCEALILDLDHDQTHDLMLKLRVWGSPVPVIAIGTGLALPNGSDGEVVLEPPIDRTRLLHAVEAVLAAGATASDGSESGPSSPAASEPPSPHTDRRPRAAADLPHPDEVATRLTVGEVADQLAAAACDRLGAESSAVLVPEDEWWSVVGGVSLRPVERRLSVPPDHWIVTSLVQQGRGAVIDRSDVARNQLAQAPLAVRQYLVIVAEPVNRAVLMVGRDTGTFDEDDLAHANELLRSASQPLREALDLHVLAVALDRFRSLR